MELSATTKEERGATMVDYAILVALLCLVCIAGVTSLRDSIQGRFVEANNAIQSSGDAGGGFQGAPLP